MRVLIIKLTSMGDLMHALPALTDASKVYPEIQFDWIVDKSFSAVPSWHPKVSKIITRIWEIKAPPSEKNILCFHEGGRAFYSPKAKNFVFRKKTEEVIINR